jgi:hypothetical protein
MDTSQMVNVASLGVILILIQSMLSITPKVNGSQLGKEKTQL